MAPPPQVTNWLINAYPRPRVDPEWLDACYEWLTSDQNHSLANLPSLLAALETQLLSSDLCDSMLHGTGLPTHVSLPTTSTTLSGPPVLVEITSITEIATSAWSLNQTRITRDERMTTEVVVDDPDAEEDPDLDGEGPMPQYPRGMLRFELSDGATKLQAMEFRSLPELALGVTPLGYKMLLKDVMIRQGVAFLEPKCVTLKGHQTADREVNQRSDFARRLHFRLGLPDPEPQPQPVPQAPPPINNLPAPPRSPLRDLSRPPSPNPPQNDDEDQPRRRRVPQRPTPAPASSSTLAPTTATSSYFSNAASTSNTDIDLTLSPAARPMAIPSISDNDDWPPGFDPADIPHEWGYDGPPSPSLSMEEQLKLEWGETGRAAIEQYNAKQVAGSSANKGKSKAAATPADVPEHSGDGSSEFGFDDGLDDLSNEHWAALDKAEQEALGQGPESRARPLSSGSGSDRRGRPIMEVITIEDDDEEGEDKENVPMPMRHVRRRIDAGGSRSGSQRHGSQRPTVVSTEVIDISDSD